MVTMDSLYEITIALSNGTIANPYNLPFPKMGFQDHPHRDMSNFEWPLSPQWVIWSTSCLVLGLGFQDRQIEWLDQIQDGGSDMT